MTVWVLLATHERGAQIEGVFSDYETACRTLKAKRRDLAEDEPTDYDLEECEVIE